MLHLVNPVINPWVNSWVNPWLLLLIPVPLIIYWLLPAARHIGFSALKIPFFKNIAGFKSHHSLNSKFSLFALLLGLLLWSLIVIAASGPQWLGKPVTLPQSGRDIILAVDLSGSMRIPDMELHGRAVNRLEVVKTAARKFIRARKGDRLGLILFGTRAYLQTPLTFDRKTVLQMLDDASIGLAGPQTAIGDALGLAIKRLKKAPGKSKVIILLTDGGNNSGVASPIQAAKVAKELGIKIYTIGIGANRLVVPGIFGPQVVHPTSALDEATLKQIAKLTNGIFFRAQSSQDLNRVYESINQIIPVVSAKNIFRPVKPLYPWPLGLALVLSCFIAARRGFSFA